MPPTVEELDARAKLAEAEAKALLAETARDEARHKAAAAVTPGNDARIAELKAAAALAAADGARSTAELEALKARIGAIPASGISGTVTLGEGAGTLETALLAAHATSKASAMIALSVDKAIPIGSTSVLVVPSGELPDFQAARAFYAQSALVTQALVDAVSESQLVDAKTLPGRGIGESLGAAGVAIDAVTKLLGFFKSDFEVRGVTLDADQPLLARSVAGALVTLFSKRGAPAPQVFLKGAFNPSSVALAGSSFRTQLASLAFHRDKAASALLAREREVTDLDAPLATSNPRAMQERDDARRQQQGAIEKLKAGLAAYETFLSKLTASDAIPVAIARELDALDAMMDPTCVHLLVKVEKVGGTSHVVKNLWTAFGMMPYRIAGGVVVSYTLFAARSGAVLAAGIIPVHGGFVSAKEVGARLREV